MTELSLQVTRIGSNQQGVFGELISMGVFICCKKGWGRLMGIEVSTDGKRLYVNESHQRKDMGIRYSYRPHYHQ